MSVFRRMEARGLSATDVRGVENILNHTHAQHEFAKSQRRPLSSFSNQSKYSSVSQSDLDPSRPSSRGTGTSSLIFRYLHPKEMKLAITNDRPTSAFFATSGSNRATRSAGPTTKRQMAVQCGIKSLPLDGKRWKTPEPKKTADSPFGKGRIVLQAPDGVGHVRRGLSGSKVRPGASTPRPVSKSSKKIDSLEVALGLRESSLHLSNSPRNSSSSALIYSQTSLNGSLEGEENPNGVAGSYAWNSSDQGLRLQKQLSSVTSVRAMRRVSEMVHHRLDPMYMINGNKVTLQDRYSVDGIEMQKLQEMTVTREELLSDLKKMKYPYGARVSAQKVNYQRQRALQNSNSYKLQGRRDPPAEPKIYPPTPTSDLSTAKNESPPKQMSQHSEEDGVVDVDDDDEGEGLDLE